MEALYIAITGYLNIACFIIGAKVGQAVSKGEKVELPKIDPMKAYREKEARKEAQKKQDKLDTILRNVDRYNGTGEGQEDVG